MQNLESAAFYGQFMFVMEWGGDSVHTHVEIRRQLLSLLSPFFTSMWVLGIDSGSPGLDGKCFHLLSRVGCLWAVILMPNRTEAWKSGYIGFGDLDISAWCNIPSWFSQILPSTNAELMEIKALLLGESVGAHIPESSRNSERCVSQWVCVSKAMTYMGLCSPRFQWLGV